MCNLLIPVRPLLLLLILLALAPLLARADEPATCTYSTYRWSVPLRRAVEQRTVRKPYAELTPAEVDAASGCSVCAEDQVEIAIDGVPTFRLCRRLAPQIEPVLRQLVASGVPLLSVTGYRVGMTRGPVDGNGLRTVFSNHAFGTALDLNAEVNGLYDHCLSFGPDCRLLLGGPWQPDHPGGLSAQSPAVVALREAGLRWGGEIAGKQKDFMHFSPSGY